MIKVVVASGILVIAAAGCSAPKDVPEAPPPTTGSSVVSQTPAARPDVIKSGDLGSMTGVVWREDVNYDSKTARNEDVTLAAGAYQVQAACSTGEVKLVAPGGSLPVACSGALGPGINVCTTKPGLIVAVERMAGPVGDLVWQLKRVDAQRCAGR